jgi:MbtH protein
MDDDAVSVAAYLVVCNKEEQHALWPAHLAVPAGWYETGMKGPREACLTYVREHWRDMCPASARRSDAVL